MSPFGGATERAVLLVEDNPADALIVEEALADAGPHWPDYVVRHEADLRAALDAIGEARPDCVLLDLGLPDAIDVLGVDRILEVHPDLPIVVLTGHDDPGTAHRALQRGAQDFLTKHERISGEMLARAIDHAIERAEAASALIESNRQLEGFAAMVAHDLRGPLSVASGMLDLVARRAGDELSDDFADLVDRAIGAIGRAADLVSSLLMYARARSSDEAATEVDLAVAAAWAWEAVDGDVAGARLDLAPDLPTVTVAEAAFRQVFQNLFSNAIAYADPQRPCAISVTAQRADDGWRIAVTDNGSGIPAERREDAFAEGERLGRSGDGLGLGLPAVGAVLERHGGRVWIEDPPEGPGTSVVFAVPD